MEVLSLNNLKSLPEDRFASTCSQIMSGVLTVLLVLLAAVFPLYIENAYFNIIQAKYRFFYVCIITTAIILLVIALIMLFIDLKEFDGEHCRNIFSALAPANIKKTFCIADAAVLLYWLSCIISTLQSEYLYESFWGNEGRFCGLFLITLYVFFYFIITRLWKPQKWILELFLISGVILCLVGITDYFKMDIFHFRDHISVKQANIFTSTIGNINTYTSYVALLIGYSASMFVKSRKLFSGLWYYACYVIAVFAIIMGCSDNAYLALGMLFAFLPFYLFQSKQDTLRYLTLIASFITAILCISLINQIYGDAVLGIDGLFNVLANTSALPVLTILFWLLVLAFYWFVVKKSGADSLFSGKKLVHAWGVLICICLAGVVFLLFDANALGHGSRYGSLSSYLVFSDSWGTNRGYIWRKSMELYSNFPIPHKLFGYGPDTFGIMTTQFFREEMIAATGQVFDNAHNEYLQLLLTIGPIGLISYIVFILKSCQDTLKASAESPVFLGCAVAVLCYFCQALVNLNVPLVTPSMWMLLSIGMAYVRRNK